MLVPPHRCLPEQPGVLVLLRVDGHDLVGIHIDPGEDLEEGLLPEAIGDGRVPPEGPEAHEGLSGTTKPKFS